MRRSMTLLAGAAMATALLATGCSAGQIAETAEKVPAVPGANREVTAPDGSFTVRNALVVYHGDGYKADGNAPLDLHIFNNTSKTVTVTVSSPDAESVSLAAGAKGTPSPSASPSASPTASATPSGEPTATPTSEPTPSAAPTEPPTRPASVQIAPGSFAALSASGQQFLELVGLKDALKPGESVELVLDFGGDAELTLNVPMGVPLTPVPRASSEVGDEEH